MKNNSRRLEIIIVVAAILVVIILAIVIIKSITKKNNIEDKTYLETITNADSNLIASYIKEGITICGITGTLTTEKISEEIYIDRIYTTSTDGYTARVAGASFTLDINDGITNGKTDVVQFSPWTTSGETDYGTLGLSNTTFSYTPKYDGYYQDGNGDFKSIMAGTKLTWSYATSKNMTFYFKKVTS